MEWKEKVSKLLEGERKKWVQIGMIILFFIILIGTLGGYYTTVKKASMQNKKVITMNTSAFDMHYMKQGDRISQTFVMPEAGLSAFYIKFYVSNPHEKDLVQVRLFEDSSEIANWNRLIEEVEKDKYAEFSLNQPILDTEEKSYRIEIEVKQLQEDSKLAFYTCSFNRIEDSEFNSYFEGQEQEKDIIFEVASTEQAYGFFYTVYVVCAILTILFFVILVVLIQKKVKWENVLVVGIFGIGLLYTIVLTPNSAPDEATHFATSYHLSNLMLFDKEDMKDGYVYMRKSDAEGEWSLCPDANTYLFLKEHMSTGAEKEKILYTFRAVLGVKNIYMYVPSALGISIGRLLNLNTNWTMELGRIFNLLFFCVMLWCAIKVTPIGKSIFASIAFFPMVLEQVTSYSYDVFVISGYFVYIAYILKLIYGKEKIEGKHIAILGVLTLIMAPCKAIYVCTAGMLLLLIKKVSKMKFLLITGTVFIAIFISNMWANWNTVSNLLGINNKVEQTVETETEHEKVQQSEEEQVPEYYSLSDFADNPKELVMIFLRTVKTSLFSYCVTMIGYRLGCLEIPVSVILLALFALMAIISASIVFDKEDTTNVYMSHRILCLLICCGVGFLAMLSMLTGWTRKGSEIILGVQGRYFLPVSVLVFFMFKSNRFKIDAKWNNPLIIFLSFLNVITLLQVLSTTMFR